MTKRDARIKERTEQKALETLPCASVDRALRTQRQKGPGPVLMERSNSREKLQEASENRGPHGASVKLCAGE